MAEPLGVKIKVGVASESKSSFSKELQTLADKTPVTIKVKVDLDKSTWNQSFTKTVQADVSKTPIKFKADFFRNT